MSAGRNIARTFKEILQTALISLGVFFFVYAFLVQPHRVKGDSMLPNFIDGELILTEKISYKLNDPKRGDVIVFQSSTSKKADFIKRIIGIPKDRIMVKDGSIYINNNKLEENYINMATEGSVERALGEDEYFVLGDNRGSSFDSRSFGSIKKTEFRGRA